MDNAREEILRYLGRKNHKVPKDVSDMLDECLELMRFTAKPRHMRLELDIQNKAEGISLNGTQLILRGRDIARRLSGCNRAVLMAATLGTAADSLIRRWERADLTRSFILDACADQLIEEVCDELENSIRENAAKSGLEATRRYSPGYGDFPLELQPEILAVLDANRRLGLTCTENLILLPRKSVTAVIGLGKAISIGCYGCEVCTRSGECELRKG